MWRAGCGLWRQEHTKERYEETGSSPSKRGGSPLDEEEEDALLGEEARRIQNLLDAPC